MDLILQELFAWRTHKKGDKLRLPVLGECTFYSYTKERDKYNQVNEYINVVDDKGHIHRRRI